MHDMRGTLGARLSAPWIGQDVRRPEVTGNLGALNAQHGDSARASDRHSDQASRADFAVLVKQVIYDRSSGAMHRMASAQSKNGAPYSEFFAPKSVTFAAISPSRYPFSAGSRGRLDLLGA
jgi:hypothetical protein